MIFELKSPVVKTLVTALRDAKTDALRFRHTVKELTRFLVYEALKDIETIDKTITTWQKEGNFQSIDENALMVVTVLRAGLPMLESVTEIFPEISSGFLAIKRDETTHEAVLYYDRLPDCKDKTILLVDPMVATGGTMIDAINIIKKRGSKKIITLNVIGSPEGLELLKNRYEDVDIYIAQIDERLNDDKFIIPGLGDAGDREYNTIE